MAVTCAVCAAQNPDGKKYCGDCGKPLPADAVARSIDDEELRTRLRAFLKDELTDQKTIEIETAQAIAVRLTDWAKLYAYLVAVPVAILLTALVVFGISSWSDVSKTVANARERIENQLAEQNRNVAALGARGKDLDSQYSILESKFSQYRDIVDRVDALSHRLDRLENLKFCEGVGKADSDRISSALHGYQTYLQDLGYRPTDGATAGICIRDAAQMNGMISYYDLKLQMVFVDKAYADNAKMFYRDYTHRVLLTMGDIGSDWTVTAVESGLALYFPCSFADDPALDAPTWDLTRVRPFRDIGPNFNSAQIVGTEVWGGAFWQMRTILGRAAADRLLFDTWRRFAGSGLKPEAASGFARMLVGAVDPKQKAAIRNLFVSRGMDPRSL